MSEKLLESCFFAWGILVLVCGFELTRDYYYMFYVAFSASFSLSSNVSGKPIGPNCEGGRFACHSGECMWKIYKCDDIPDCADGSDESQCHVQDCDPETHWLCPSTASADHPDDHECILLDKVSFFKAGHTYIFLLLCRGCLTS